MEFGEYTFYIVLEALILVSAYAVYLHISRRRLLTRQQRGDAGSPAEVSAVDRYTELLQQEILRAEARLAKLGSEDKPDPARVSVIETRLGFLRGERQAIDRSGQDEDRLWTLIADTLAPYLPTDNSDQDVDELITTDQSSLVEVLQSRIKAYETRVANLEQFKDKFFAIKDKYSSTRELNGKLHVEIEKAVPEQEQSPELKETLQQLQQENAHLESQLELVEREFQNIMTNLQATTDRSDLPKPELGITNAVDHIGEGVGRIKNVIAEQEQKIEELNGMLSALEIELAQQERIKGALDELQAKHDELNNVISIIQEENDFLQEQISALLKQELDKEGEATAERNKLQQELQDQLQAYAELETRYAAMEREYLATFEENERLKG